MCEVVKIQANHDPSLSNYLTKVLCNHNRKNHKPSGQLVKCFSVAKGRSFTFLTPII